jgi:hypothetical protein
LAAFALRRKRGVETDVFANAHTGASNTIRYLSEKYANDPRVNITIVNNPKTRADIHEGMLSDVHCAAVTVFRTVG